MFVTDPGAVFFCNTVSWTNLSGNNGIDGINGTDGAGCIAVPNKDELGNNISYSVMCDGNLIGTLHNGNDGASCIAEEVANGYAIICDGVPVGILRHGTNGTSCTAVPTATGFDVICADKLIGSLTNGAKGEPGEKGDTGARGATGAKGDTGDGCSIVAQKNTLGNLTGEYTITCGKNSITLKDGLKGDNGENCTIADELDEDDNKTGNYTLTCDGKTVTVKNGNDGTNCTAVPTTDKNGKEDGRGFVITCGGVEKGTILNGAKGDTGDKGETGDGCSVEAVKDKDDNLTGEYTVTCGESVITLKDGLKGNDGESCTAEPTTDKNGKEDGKGFVITCGGEEKGTILNGTKGDTGDKGETGEGCTVEAVKDEDENPTGEYTVTCGESSITLKDGLKGDNGESCTVQPTTDEETGLSGVIIKCGTMQSTIWNGADGKDATITDQSKQEILDWLTEYDLTDLSTCDENNVNEIKNLPLSNRIGITIRYWKCSESDDVYNWVKTSHADYEAYIESLTPDPEPEPETEPVPETKPGE